MSAATAGVGECVLVVDDAADLRGLVALVLRRAGYEVLEAATAAEAVTIHAVRDLDALLVDVQLGDVNGLDVAAAVRSSPRGSDVRIVLVTASPNLDPALLAALGIDGVLAKPVTVHEILGAVGGSPPEKTRV